MSSVTAERHVKQGGYGCASVFLAAGVFHSNCPLGTVNNNIIIMVIFKCYFSGELIALT